MKDTSKRNSMAGKHPSYKGRSEASIAKKRAYDTEYHSTPARKKYRAELNRANRNAGTYGNKDGIDMSHTKSGKLVRERQSTNRGRNGNNGKSSKK